MSRKLLTYQILVSFSLSLPIIAMFYPNVMIGSSLHCNSLRIDNGYKDSRKVFPN